MKRHSFLMTRCFKTAALIPAVALLFTVHAYSQGGLGGSELPPEVMNELQFIEQLNAWGMPTFAEELTAKLPRLPGLKVHIQRLKIQSLIATGKFDDVKAIIAREPSQQGAVAWGLKLAMADGYYAWGKYKEAQALYEEFFQKFPDGPTADLNTFYMESAYKYAQMMLLMGDKQGAMKGYESILKCKLPSHVKRQVWSETAEIMLTIADDTEDPAKRAVLIKKVEAMCSKILWVQDLWFGKAIVYLAHIAVLQDKPEEAEKLIKEFKGQLEAIDAALQESAKLGDDLTKLSPMAECRYLIGKMMYDVAIKEVKRGGKDKAIVLLLGKDLGKGKRSNGALHHFINVFIRYPNTSWAPDAGLKVEEIKKIAVEDLGAKEIKFKITPEQWEAVRKSQFQEARSLFNRQMFEQAVDAYIKVLNLFPDGDTSIRGISELALCYIELEQYFDAEMVVRYLAECFSKKKESQALAGDKMLTLASKFESTNRHEEKDMVHNLYFAEFTEHSRAAAMIFHFAERKMKEENYPEALGYYNSIIEHHKKSNLYPHCLYKASVCYGKLEKKTTEIKTLQALVKFMAKEPEGEVLLLTAKFGVAQGYRQIAKEKLSKKDSEKDQEYGNKYMSAAAGKYLEIITMLSKPDHPYKSTPEDAKFSATVLEGSLFFKAYCYMMLTQPKEKIGQYKSLAIQGFKELVREYPKSIYAAQALSQTSALYTLFKKTEEAQEALQMLKQKFPESNEAKNADFALGITLLEMGNKRAAIRAFQSMIQGEGKYTARKILIAGTELIKPGVELYDVALEAFEKALTMSEDRNIVEPARLGMGQALTELGKVERATEVLDKLMVDFPSSGYTVETGFFLAQAASAYAMTIEDDDKRFTMFNKAMAALKRVRKYAAKDLGLKAKTDLEIGLILEKKAESEEKFGTPERRIKYIEDAIGSYQVMMMFSDHRNPDIRPHIDDAYKRCIGLMFTKEKWSDIVADSKKYLSIFPSGRNVRYVRSLMNKAVVKVRMQGIADAPTAQTTDGAPATNAPAEKAPVEKAPEEKAPAVKAPAESE